MAPADDKLEALSELEEEVAQAEQDLGALVRSARALEVEIAAVARNPAQFDHETLAVGRRVQGPHPALLAGSALGVATGAAALIFLKAMLG
jgi:hypothetical protein